MDIEKREEQSTQRGFCLNNSTTRLFLRPQNVSCGASDQRGTSKHALKVQSPRLADGPRPTNNTPKNRAQGTKSSNKIPILCVNYGAYVRS